MGEDQFTWKHRALYNLMREISEDCYCAGWMNGNEYTLWEMVANPEASRRYGQDEVTLEQIADLRTMSAELGGWIRWHDDNDDPDLPSQEWGPRFELLTDWQPRFATRMAEWAELRAKYATPQPAPQLMQGEDKTP
jgi:hypothetical protein